MPGTNEIREALAELQAFAQRMGFVEAVAGLTQALDRLPSGGAPAAALGGDARANNH